MSAVRSDSIRPAVKAKIHPEYVKAVVTCACGNTFETRSTSDKIAVEICSECHPFYTGKQKFVDTAGKIERFRRKWGTLEERQAKETAANEPKKQIRKPKDPIGKPLQSLPEQKKKKEEKPPADEKPLSTPPPNS